MPRVFCHGPAEPPAHVSAAPRPGCVTARGGLASPASRPGVPELPRRQLNPPPPRLLRPPHLRGGRGLLPPPPIFTPSRAAPRGSGSARRPPQNARPPPGGRSGPSAAAREGQPEGETNFFRAGLPRCRLEEAAAAGTPPRALASGRPRPCSSSSRPRRGWGRAAQQRRGQARRGPPRPAAAPRGWWAPPRPAARRERPGRAGVAALKDILAAGAQPRPPENGCRWSGA